jgi:hypothetical protein
MAEGKSNKDAGFKVVSPMGDVVVEDTPMAPRPDTLDGKTICLTWNVSFRADVTLSVIAELLSKKYPNARVIPYNEMPDSYKAPPPGTTNPEKEAMVAAFKAYGCDAVISGNGG